MSSSSDIHSPPLPSLLTRAPGSAGRKGNRRQDAVPVISTVVQLDLFQFYEKGYTPSESKADYSVELNQEFRRQVFREPMRLLQALPKLTVLERRLYWLVLSALKTYQYLQQASPTSLPLLEQRLSFQFHRTRLRATEDKTGKEREAPTNISVLEVKKTLHTLSTRTIKWENSKGDLVSAHMFDTQYLMGEGLMVLELNPKLTEAFLKLGNNFAQFNLQKALRLKSEYSQLLYSYFSKHQWRGKWKVSIQHFRQFMDIVDIESYDRFGNISRRIIDPALNEINALGDMIVTYETTTFRRQVTDILFTIKAVNQQPDEAQKNEAKLRLEKLLVEIGTMTFAQKLTFTAGTLESYYTHLTTQQKERILSERALLDAFLRADAYVEAGMVHPSKHDAYVATSVFGHSNAKKSRT